MPILAAGDDANGPLEPVVGAPQGATGETSHEESPSVTKGSAKHDAPADEPSGIGVQKKRNKKRKKANTAMPKNRGTGFEGMASLLQTRARYTSDILTQHFC